MTGQKPEVILALVKAGANLNATDADGGAPLMYATGNENAQVLIPAFLKAGADPKLKSNEGKIALDYAKANEKLKGTDALKQLEDASK
jgi:ankyrin repeat protein